ncbi:hypothetical protein HK102_013260, partial [Quaeritorhiza haematococci]
MPDAYKLYVPVSDSQFSSRRAFFWTSCVILLIIAAASTDNRADAASLRFNYTATSSYRSQLEQLELEIEYLIANISIATDGKPLKYPSEEEGDSPDTIATHGSGRGPSGSGGVEPAVVDNLIRFATYS